MNQVIETLVHGNVLSNISSNISVQTPRIVDALTYNDLFDNIVTALNALADRALILAIPSLVIVFICIGFMHYLGDEMSRNGKRMLRGALIGSLFIFGATVLATTLQSVLGF